MSCDEWVRGPFGLDAAKGETVPGERRVLVVVHHLAAGTRLADVVPMLERDRRVQVAYTAPPTSIHTRELPEYLRGLGGVVLPWEQATQLPFDLAIAANQGMLERIHAPVLTMRHGAGQGRLFRRIEGFGPEVARPPSGMQRERLIVGGRVVPSAIMVPHESQLRLLKRECPEALGVAFVGGDPCLDRLMASRRLRRAYRRALGVGPKQRLVLISSTWRHTSLLGQDRDALYRIASALPRDRYRIVAALHPNIWSFHSRRQVTSWQTDCLRLGVRLLPPEEGWRAALVAADRIIGDHGSVTCYGAAMGVPVALGSFCDDGVVPGSAVARLGMIAPKLDWDHPLQPQVEEAEHAFPELRDALTSRPGASARILRREMYRLMRLPEPESPPCVEAVPPPRPIPYGRWLAA